VDVTFGGVQALRGFSLALEAGEIHGLIGPNGAGKTTAINAISGTAPRAAGTIELDGNPIAPSPKKLVSFGIGRTFQTPAIFFDLNAVGNVLVGAYARGTSGIWRGSLATSSVLHEEQFLTARAVELLRSVGYEGDPETPSRLLSFGALRQIEIARMLMSEPRIILLDEPTAGLASHEVARFVAVMRELRRRRGVTILLVEHNVPFVFSLCDTVTAMYEGARIATGTPAEIRAHEDVVQSYLGHQHGTGEAMVSSKAEQSGGRVLELRDVTSGYGATTILRNVNLHVGSGEIVALLGRNGAGKTTLLNTIMGDPRARGGEILWEGRSLRGLAPDRVVAAGIGLVPQDRAVIVHQSVDDNLELATFGLRLSRREFGARRDEMLARFPRLLTRRKSLGGSLSGGERQMLAIAKVLMRRPRLLLLDEPSIGLAPAIVQELQGIIASLRDDGLPIVVAEQNVSWISPLSARAYLLEGGRIVDEGPPERLARAGALTEAYLGTA
jgi:branched-chain amino acid transport system ATP-binding protein